MTLNIIAVNMLHVQDNWNWLLHDDASGMTAVIDPSEASGIEAALEEKGLGLDFILCTHHHWDHTNGNLALKARYGCQIVGAAADAARIRGIDVALAENESFMLGGHCVETFDISGHTIGHIAFYCRQDKALFVGDTLFAMGCGRMFEGTPEIYHASLQKIVALPDETQIYCAHEYTLANGRFARAMEPDNEAIAEHMALAKARRKAGLPSLPTSLAREKATNPFLRTHSASIRKTLEMPANASDTEVFAALRRAKDVFKGNAL